ncbi:MAG: UDP-N-acetylmuramate dehydrogenase [Sphaerochaetaceae bacterium]
MSTTIRKSTEKINIDSLVRVDVALAPFSTFHTGGSADFFAQPADEEELRVLVKWAYESHTPVTVLAGGSNVLISDDGVEGLVISTLKLKSFHVRGILFVAQVGLNLDEAITYSIERSLSGLEALGGLPGTIGGAVFGNAASRGVALGSLVEWVDYLDEKGSIHRYFGIDGGFSYKESPFKGTTHIMTQVALRLIPNKNTSEARLQKEQAKNERLASGQFEFPSAGCMFKNPHHQSAGELIDLSSLKGKKVGGAVVSSNHANFIVNPKGKATSNDIYELMNIVKEQVEKKQKVILDPEIRLIGRW